MAIKRCVDAGRSAVLAFNGDEAPEDEL